MGLDTVEIVMTWEETFGVTITDEDASSMLTPQIAIDYFCERLGADDTPEYCPTLRAFHHSRRVLCECCASRRRDIRMSTPLKGLYSRSSRGQFWECLRRHPGFDQLPTPGWISGTRTVSDMVHHLITDSSFLRGADGRWTRSLVRSVVRSTVRDYVSRRFRDDEHFIHDLGLD